MKTGGERWTANEKADRSGRVPIQESFGSWWGALNARLALWAEGGEAEGGGAPQNARQIGFRIHTISRWVCSTNGRHAALGRGCRGRSEKESGTNTRRCPQIVGFHGGGESDPSTLVLCEHCHYLLYGPTHV
jgi:hypothetical protein